MFHSLNGTFVAQEDAKVHASDLTFRRGFGAFDYLRIFDGTPLFIEDHLDRFANTAAMLGIDMPMSQAELTEHVLELVTKNAQDTAGLQLFLTGGYSVDGFTPTEPNLIILQNPLPQVPDAYYDNGATLISHEYLRDLPQAKTTNYMMAVVLGKNIREVGATDALYYHGDSIMETTRSNFFIVSHDDVIVTANEHILHGVTRKHILQVARKHWQVEERRVSWEDLKNAKEAFITSTTKGALPIVKIDDLIINTGHVGEVCQALMGHFSAHRQAYIAAAKQKQAVVAG
jgi:branched-subunit amino acid aminotransferase/4-amino-4-deoxychorismate lyase